MNSKFYEKYSQLILTNYIDNNSPAFFNAYGFRHIYVWYLKNHSFSVFYLSDYIFLITKRSKLGGGVTSEIYDFFKSAYMSVQNIFEKCDYTVFSSMKDTVFFSDESAWWKLRVQN
jgi:hypothetical protein